MTTQISGFADKHLPSVVDLLNEEYRASYEFIPFDEERVMSQIRRRHLKILVAEEKEEILGLIGTHSHENSEEDISWLAARKGSSHRAIEDLLVSTIEKNPEFAIIVTMIDEGSPKIKDWISRGYTLQAGFQRMSAELDNLKPIPSVDEDIHLRSLRPDEERKFVAVVNAGFGWRRLELGDLQAWKSEDPPFNEDWVQVAETGGKIVSVVVAKPDTDCIKYLHVKRGYLGPATTLRKFRNMHLASALTARAMNLLFEKGMNSVRLGTSEQNASSIALLKSLGFRVDVVRKTLSKKLENP